MYSEIREIFINKSNKLNNRWKYIYNNLDHEYKTVINNSYPEYTELIDKLKSIINSGYKKCTICSSVMRWEITALTCSKICLNEQIKRTNIEKYGVDNVFKSKEIQDKIKSTNIERYGSENVMHNESIVKKLKQTNIERYGSENVMHNDLILEKLKQTNIERYGGNSPQSDINIKAKSINTCIEKYGVEYPLQNKEIKSKKKNTDIEKYGVDHHFKNETIKGAIKQAHFNNKLNYIFKYVEPSRVDISLVKNVPIDINRKYTKEYISKVVGYVSNNTIPDKLSIKNEYSQSRYNKLLKIYGYDDKRSFYESELVKYLHSLGIEFVENDRNVLAPYELDIYIPTHNLAIEFNGYYWHSDKFKDKKYHQMKTKLCNEKGITLIHIHEYLYIYKKDVFSSIIKAKLGLNERVYARKCILREVDKNEERIFLDQYHLQGFVGSNKCYGLYYNDELLTLCSFGKSRFNKNYKYELLRNCSKPGITVVGGLSKLINYFKKTIDNTDIICYSDASISYNKNSKLTNPNYVWIKNNKILTRYQTMKHKLEKLLEDFDESLSESENMNMNGYYRVYDSGNYITII